MRFTVKNAKLSLVALAALITIFTTPAYAQSQPFPAQGGGTGTGDVAGPSSSTDGNFAGFNGSSGKAVKDLGIGPSDFSPAGKVALVSGSDPTPTAADWAAFIQYTITGSGRTLTLPDTSTLSTNGGALIDTNAASVTVDANASDTITYDGATTATGGSVTLPQGGLYAVSTDGAGKLYISAPPGGSSGSPVSPINVKAGRFYWTSPSQKSQGSTFTSGTVYFSDFTLYDDTTIDQLGTYVTTTDAAGHLANAIYAVDATSGYATGAPIVTTSSLSTASSTVMDTGLSSTSLPKGHYKFAFMTDSTTVKVMSNTTSSHYEGFAAGSDTAAHLTSGPGTGTTVYSIAGTYGTWPTMNGTGGTGCTGNCTAVSVGFNQRQPYGIYRAASVP